MHITRSLALVAATAGLAITAPSALATTDHSFSLSPAKLSDSAIGATATGFNVSWLVNEIVGTPAPMCGKNPNNLCETTLVHVTADNVGGGTLKLRIDGFQQYSDFDLKSFESDAAGTQVKNLGSPTGDPTATSSLPIDALSTAAGDFETKNIDLAGYVDTETNTLDAYFLAVVPYFTVPNDSYKITATMTTSAPEPPEEDGE